MCSCFWKALDLLLLILVLLLEGCSIIIVVLLIIIIVVFHKKFHCDWSFGGIFQNLLIILSTQHHCRYLLTGVFLLSLLCFYGIISHSLLPLGIAMIIILIIFLLLCILLFVFPYHQPLGLLLTEGGCGIFKLFNDLSMCCAHKGKTNTDESAQV